ncbi:uncharacterized protein LOC113383763 isoform X2 [Ctenocephalides felis]|uniref:uncharacterized protein LOC113383763 isoform X2 n=1 Tax=Ctenocephalides felis TaxID=7515 RepID=UPI000E6E519E|nr:uncharacterized protein LOC113383763 isoform X2 [Ctenocephalides felis]
MCTIRSNETSHAGLDMGSEHYCLRWNNHQSNLLGVFSQLLHDESLVDVTLACSEGASIRAHKVVLSACSSYFQALFLDHPSRHPIVILKDVHFAELRTLVEFMYKGEVNVQYCQLSALLKTAESLKVKGLAEMTNLNAATTTSNSSSTISAPMMHDAPSESVQTHQIAPIPGVSSNSTTNNISASTSISSTITRHQNNTTTAINQLGPILGSTSTNSTNTNSSQINQQMPVSGSTLHQPNESSQTSRISIDTLTRHDRKQNNHHADISDTSIKRHTNNITEQSYTPPPRLEQSPLSLIRAKPPETATCTPMACDDTDDDETPATLGKSINNNNTSSNATSTPLVKHSNCTDVGLNMSISSSSEHSTRIGVASSQVAAASLATSMPLLSSSAGGGPPLPQAAPPPSTSVPLPSPPQPPQREAPPDPLPGPSGLPPVQQVPLSLKKEVDWERAVEEIKAESSSAEYLRHAHDQRDMASRLMSVSPFTFPFHPPLFDPEASARLMALLQQQQSFGLGLRFNQLFAEDLLKHKHATEEALRLRRNLPEEETQEESVSGVRCNVCFASFPSAWLLEQHTALQHLQTSCPSGGGEDKPFICDQCGQSYRYRSAYVKHREQNHRARLPADKLFTCDVCGMQFRYLKSFKKHRLNHALERLHGKSEMFASGTSSDNQVSSSNEITPAAGEGIEEMSDQDDTVDSATASASSELSKQPETSEVEHDPEIEMTRESVPEVTETDPVVEPSETKSNSTLTMPPTGISMDAHEASLLNYLRADAVSRQRERRFACPFCGKCVRSKENLKLHVRKHTGERPFVCLFCGRAFGGKSDLTRHLRIHTGERPYHCEACGKCFARADYLSKHLTTHIHNAPR